MKSYPVGPNNWGIFLILFVSTGEGIGPAGGNFPNSLYVKKWPDPCDVYSIFYNWLDYTACICICWLLSCDLTQLFSQVIQGFTFNWCRKPCPVISNFVYLCAALLPSECTIWYQNFSFSYYPWWNWKGHYESRVHVPCDFFQISSYESISW